MSTPSRIDLELAKHTKRELAQMVADLTDGQDASDIHHCTGMPVERCQEIVEAGHGVLQALWG